MKPLFESDLVERVLAILDEADMAYKDFGLDHHEGEEVGDFYKIRFENHGRVGIFADKIRFSLGRVSIDYDVDEENDFIKNLKDAVSLFKDGKLPKFDLGGDWDDVEDKEN